MASFTVEKRKTAAGVIRYRCIVRVKKDKTIVYQESRTFGKLADARTWGNWPMPAPGERPWCPIRLVLVIQPFAPHSLQYTRMCNPSPNKHVPIIPLTALPNPPAWAQ